MPAILNWSVAEAVLARVITNRARVPLETVGLTKRSPAHSLKYALL